MVQGKSRAVNHVNNVEIRYRWNLEDGTTRQSNQNVHIIGIKPLKIIALVRILLAVSYDGHTNVRQIDEPQDQIITMSNELKNPKD